jgi:hypothetical protein
MDEQIIVLSSSSSSDSCDTEVLMAYANRLNKPQRAPNYDLVRGMCFVNNPHFSEPHFISTYSPQSFESGESVTQHVNTPSKVLNPESPVYVEMIRKSLENPLDSAKTESNPGRRLIKTHLSLLDPGSHLKNLDELSSSMTNSLDSESDPAYQPSSSSTSNSPLSGSNRSSCALVDMAPKRTRHRVTKVAGNKGNQDDAEQAGPSGVRFKFQAMRMEWAGIRGIGNLLWVPTT